jgi:hypothetical protein
MCERVTRHVIKNNIKNFGRKEKKKRKKKHNDVNVHMSPIIKNK